MLVQGLVSTSSTRAAFDVTCRCASNNHLLVDTAVRKRGAVELTHRTRPFLLTRFAFTALTIGLGRGGDGLVLPRLAHGEFGAVAVGA